MLESLRSRLAYEPRELKFGTSGRRGEVAHLTQLEIYITALGELEYLQSLPRSDGGIVRDDPFYFARDLRPSSLGIAQAIECAIQDAGMRPVNCGCIPTPALACSALARRLGSMMITGSHIPFDRNGYKTSSSVGELLKEQEQPIGEMVGRVRARIYEKPFAASRFDERGRFKPQTHKLPPENTHAAQDYARRYTDFFEGTGLHGKRLLFYQHSGVGRDLVPDILTRLGAEVILTGSSDTFVPIDTENIDAALLGQIQSMVDAHPGMDAVISTDGDSDRPLMLGVENGRARFFPGDLVGMITAQYLGADAVVVPISCNDAIDRSSLAPALEPKTKIGSPYVIAGMEHAKRQGRRRVCGWEANGGFLTGSDIERHGRVLKALPTRDAVLPILCALFSAQDRGAGLTELFATLPRRFSRSGLLRGIPRDIGLRIADAARDRLPDYFGAAADVNDLDGVRMSFRNGEVVHLRPSGNADELRIYAVADSAERAEEIVALGIREPDGILRTLERAVTVTP